MSGKRVKVVRERRSADRWVREERMREAEVAFILDKQRRPPEFWWDQICQRSITLQDFLVRVRRGQWVVRRDQYWAEVTQEILRQSKHRAVHDRVKELQEISQVRSDVLEAMTPRVVNGVKRYPVKPGSFEGMVSAFAKLDVLADAKRDAVLTMIEPELAMDSADGPSSTFTAEEWRTISRKLLEDRRTKRLNEGAPDGSDSKTRGEEGPGEEGPGEEGPGEEGPG